MDLYSIESLRAKMHTLQINTSNSTNSVNSNTLEESSELRSIQIFLDKLKPYMGNREDLEGCGAGSFVVQKIKKTNNDFYKVSLFACSKTKKVHTIRPNRSDQVESIYCVFKLFLGVTSQGYSYSISSEINTTENINTAVLELLCEGDIANQDTNLVISSANPLDSTITNAVVNDLIISKPHLKGKILKISRKYLKDNYNLLSPYSIVAIDANRIYYLVHGKKGLKGIGGFKKVKELRALDGDDLALSIPQDKYINGEFQRTEILQTPCIHLKNFLLDLENLNSDLLNFFCVPKYYNGMSYNESNKRYTYKSYLVSILYEGNLKELDFKNIDFDNFMNILRWSNLPIQRLHDYGLVHFDIKPHNYLFKRDEDSYQIALTDFDFLLKITENLRDYISIRGTKGYRPGTLISQKTKVCKSYAFKVDTYAYLKTVYVLLSDFLKDSSLIPHDINTEDIMIFFKKCFDREKQYIKIMQRSADFVKCNGSIKVAISELLPEHLLEKWNKYEEWQRLKQIYQLPQLNLHKDYWTYMDEVKLIEKTDIPILSIEEFANQHKFYESSKFYLLALSTLLTEDYLEFLPSLSDISFEINKLRY